MNILPIVLCKVTCRLRWICRVPTYKCGRKWIWVSIGNLNL